MKKFQSTILLFLLLGGVAFSQKGKLALHSKTFNLKKFAANLKTQIAASSVTTTPEGYSFMINRDGKIADSFSTGNAYKTNTGTVGKWTTNQEINIASVTKMLSGIAVIQLLKKNNLKITDPIGQWLPAYFNATTAIRNTTFEQLLTHSSGILESNTSYDTIRAIVTRPLADPTRKANQYSNVNFALFRIMIPYLRDNSSAKNQEQAMVPSNISGFEQWLSSQYVGYMQQNVFSPAGIGITNCKPSLNSAQAFSEPSGNTQALANNGDWTETCGGGGFYMSVKEMAKVMAYLGHSTSLLSLDQRKLMDTKLLGWDQGTPE